MSPPPGPRRHEPDWSIVLLDRVTERRHLALGLGALAAAGYVALTVVGFAVGWAGSFLARVDGGMEPSGWIPWLAMLLLPAVMLLPVPWFLAHPDVSSDVEAPSDFSHLIPGSEHRKAGELLLNSLFLMPQTLAEALRVLLPGRGWTDERIEAGAATLAGLYRAGDWLLLHAFLREADESHRRILIALLDLDLAWTKPAPMTRESPGGEPMVRLNPQLIP